MSKLIIFLLAVLPLKSKCQYGEGRLGNLTENKAHGFGGMAIGGLVYEVGRTKNNWQLDPEQFQRKEAKNIYRTAIIGAAFAGAIEVTDYLKGGKPSFEDFGNTVGGVLTYAIGRFAVSSILQDRMSWRRKGMRLRLGAHKIKNYNGETIKTIYYYKNPTAK